MKTILTTPIFDAWFDALRDKQAKARINARIRRITGGNLGDYKLVGSGIAELRIHYGPGYRLYFVQKGMDIIILLAGGDKTTQENDIKLAKQLLKEI